MRETLAMKICFYLIIYFIVNITVSFNLGVSISMDCSKVLKDEYSVSSPKLNSQILDISFFHLVIFLLLQVFFTLVLIIVLTRRTNLRISFRPTDSELSNTIP